MRTIGSTECSKIPPASTSSSAWNPKSATTSAGEGRGPSHSHTPIPTHPFPHTHSHTPIPTHPFLITHSQSPIPTFPFPHTHSHIPIPTHPFPHTHSYYYYTHSRSQPRPLPKVRGQLIESVAWNKVEQGEHGTGPILLGTSNGEVGGAKGGVSGPSTNEMGCDVCCRLGQVKN